MELLFGPLIQAFARKLSCQGCLRMDVRRDAEHNLARERLFRALADLFTGGEVVISGLMEGCLQHLDTVSMEADNVIDAGEPPNKKIIISTELHAGQVSLIAHDAHGRTPNLVRNSRASRT